MSRAWLGRLTAVTGMAVVLGVTLASPAWADSTVDINPGNVPATASGYGTKDCDPNFGGGPHANLDVWVFVLPQPNQAGAFLSVTATFSTPDGPATLTIPSDGGAIVDDKGTSKAWITTAAGWTLTGATAKITGTVAKFNLTHTCPAGAEQTPSPSPSPSLSSSASPSPSPSDSSSSPSPSAPPAPGDGGGLPVTGTAVTGMVVTGGALVAGGVALLMLRRRREPAFAAETPNAPNGGDPRG
nr:LPXTG cell wall anchor domain-containing protein [Micromonospora sp. DSM 115978]